jgi:energy coupling factor transporter S component ThiW
MKTQKLTFSSLLIAFGVATGSFIYIPVGASKCFPVQHTINVLAAFFLGPPYGVAIAFIISLLRNFLGRGTLLAFPGSMIGAFMAGIMFKKTKSLSLAAAGEIMGTGILGALAAFPIAKLFMGRESGALFFVIPFLISTIGGSLIAYFAIRLINYAKVINFQKRA